MQNIPNLITSVNLLAGCSALIGVCTSDYRLLFGSLLLSLLADFADGLLARALNADTVIGKELDSLADMVSFGLVPGLIMYRLIQGWEQDLAWDYIALFGFFITICSAWRLAKFNTDSRQSDEFRGLNTPTNTVFVYGLYAMIHHSGPMMPDWINGHWFLLACTLISGALLVSDLRMFKLKFQAPSKAPLMYILAIISLGLLLWLKERSFSFIVILYVLFSLIAIPFTKTKNT